MVSDTHEGVKVVKKVVAKVDLNEAVKVVEDAKEDATEDEFMSQSLLTL